MSAERLSSVRLAPVRSWQYYTAELLMAVTLSAVSCGLGIWAGQRDERERWERDCLQLGFAKKIQQGEREIVVLKQVGEVQRWAKTSDR